MVLHLPLEQHLRPLVQLVPLDDLDGDLVARPRARRELDLAEAALAEDLRLELVVRHPALHRRRRERLVSPRRLAHRLERQVERGQVGGHAGRAVERVVGRREAGVGVLPKDVVAALDDGHLLRGRLGVAHLSGGRLASAPASSVDSSADDPTELSGLMGVVSSRRRGAACPSSHNDGNTSSPLSLCRSLLNSLSSRTGDFLADFAVTGLPSTKSAPRPRRESTAAWRPFLAVSALRHWLPCGGGTWRSRRC